MTCGLTRMSLHMMDQRIPQTVIAELTGIPAPTISQYAIGTRRISKRHLPILALALGLATDKLVGYATDDECFVLENEWCDTNPFYYLRKYSTRSPCMDNNNPIVHHKAESC
jgi:hypothetical protein